MNYLRECVILLVAVLLASGIRDAVYRAGKWGEC